MTREKCEREPLVVAAARSGNWPAELEHHVAACAPCAETKRVAQLFLDHAATTSTQTQPPAANIVWQKLQAQRQRQALIRATRCMTLMRILAALYAVAVGVWYLPQLWRMQPAQLSTALSALSGGSCFPGSRTRCSISARSFSLIWEYNGTEESACSAGNFLAFIDIEFIGKDSTGSTRRRVPVRHQ